MRLFAVAAIAVVVISFNPAFAADSAKQLIVGKWRPNDKEGEKAVIEFTKDGKVKVISATKQIDGAYTFVKDNQIEVTMSIMGKEAKVKLDIKVTKEELTTTEQGADKQTATFKRVK